VRPRTRKRTRKRAGKRTRKRGEHWGLVDSLKMQMQ
jgi:hypothetical protein